MEYAKLNLEPTNNHPIASNSDLWCIIRLRRLISVEKSQTSNVDILIAKILELLDKQDSNSAALNKRISNACLGLVHEEKAFPVIERFVCLALSQREEVTADLINFDPPQRLLSDQFLSHLAANDCLRKQAVICWSNETKTRLLLHYSELLDTEILDLIALYIYPNNYTSIHAIQQQLCQYHLLKIAMSSSALSEILIAKLASYVVLLADWRVVRIMQSVYRILETARSCKIFTEFISQEFKSLSNYIYNGSLTSIETRRNMIWCLSLASIRNIWPLIDTLVNWVQTSDLWSCVQEDILVYVNWIICPTNDNRESRSFDDLKSWIQSNQGKGLFHNLASLWRKLFSGNAVILSLFVISILNQFSSDQQISLIQTIYFSSVVEGDDPISRTVDDKKNNMANIYILLDSLEDLESMIPTVNVPHIINHIHVQLLK
ncbi:hypothetical protein BD408DRAFT_93770 [Parasitella parasitica]|nr:hypothetical protein BD408DRAFT_93770 [Parasitella parasitica]